MEDAAVERALVKFINIQSIINMGFLNVLKAAVGLEPDFTGGSRTEDEYTVCGRDADGYYFEMEYDHPDPFCNMMMSRGYGWRHVRSKYAPSVKSI